MQSCTPAINQSTIWNISFRSICVIRSFIWVKSERTAKTEAYNVLSLPFDIIDSDHTVCFWLLPLLHDSRLRTCFPRYDKQHDASDACNDADIMHTCRWYGTKRQDVFSNVTITIKVDARGKARRRVRILVKIEGKVNVSCFQDIYTKGYISRVK